ncbi:MAG: hypothetical protein RSB83_11820, partial [Brevundimonas sp.]
MSHSMIRHGKLSVAAELDAFVRDRAVAGTGVTAEGFWAAVDGLVARFADANRELLAKRDRLQSLIDDWHCAHPGQPDQEAYQAFLTGIGYIEAPLADATVRTANVDAELASMAGPQLVVPLTNARFLLNAANARGGSLFVACYGSDALGELPQFGPGHHVAQFGLAQQQDLQQLLGVGFQVGEQAHLLQRIGRQV